MIIAIDPGREKCGIAVLDERKTIQFKAVVNTKSLVETADALIEQYNIEIIVIGDGTGSKNAQAAIHTRFKDSGKQICIVDEYRTTDMARQRYWRENSPRGWRRLLPVSMQTPPVPVDDYVAVILAETYMSGQSEKCVRKKI